VRGRLEALPLQRVWTTVGPAVVIVALQAVIWQPPGRVYVSGLVFGLLGALVALGMALVYRANRILSFAQADLGVAPAIFGISFLAFWGWSWWLAATIGLVSAFLLGAVVEFVIIRRFFRSPRLILTVATIGVAQLLALVAVLIPRLWGEDPTSRLLTPPFDWGFSVGEVRYGAGSVMALVIAPLVMVALAVFLRSTSVGIAVRATAERADRAASLGIPVMGLQTLVWSLAAALSFVGVFLKANIVALPLVSTISFVTLLAALAALMLGRLTNLPAVAVSAVALGILEQSVIYATSDDALVGPVLGVVIIVALLLRRRTTSRASADDTSSWQSADAMRPIPHELRRVPEVAFARVLVPAVVVGAAVLLPTLLGSGDQARASAVVVIALVCLSIVVLTGWAGQVSLGQMSFVGIGAAVGALATAEWGLDLAAGMVVSGLAGSAAAVVVGLPALRLRGLYLAVVTLGFALATSSYLLSRRYFDWIPRDRLERPLLFGSIDVSSELGLYWLCLATLVAAIVAVRGIRSSRIGRSLVAVRDNERGAQAYGIDLTRAKLGAFALSGFLAATAGYLSVQLTQQFDEFAYTPADSIAVFTAAVVGGLGAPLGAVLGAVFLQGGDYFLPSASGSGQTAAIIWDLLPTSLGVLLVLLAFPSGLGGLVIKVRDIALRRVARRRDIVVPSLVADVQTADISLERAASESTDDELADATVPGGAS
jgi:branched-chain amino acid transport system permease protein